MVSAPGRADLAIDLVQAVGRTPLGSTTTVAVRSAADVEFIDRWCIANRCTPIAVHDGAVEIYRGSRADSVSSLPAERMPGYRLWIYTNFHCNLRCAYCCAESSPRADPRSLDAATVAVLVDQAVALGTKEIYLTGGEPFLNEDIADIAGHCARVAPTVLLTNGMLFAGSRRRLLDAIPRRNVMLQISVDSPTPEIHDSQRGAGSWAKAIEGARLARGLGFRLRLAATIAAGSAAQEAELRELCHELDIGDDDMVIRRVAAEGFATEGLVVTRESVLPEVCVTAQGVYWHPVAVANPSMRVSDSILPLAVAVTAIRAEFLEYRRRGDVLASSFPCA